MAELLDAVLSRRSLVKGSVAAGAVAALPLTFQTVAAQDAIVATMVTDTTGLGDQNFNDLANKGGTEGAAEFGGEWKVIESVDEASYVPNLTLAAEQGQLVAAIGYKLQAAIDEVAPQFADKSFLHIDAASSQPNVRGVLYKEDQIGFLVGVVAALMTKTKKLGVIGGERIPPVIRYEVGFVAGVKSVDPSVEIIINYTDTFGDSAKGKDTASAQYNQGADIVFPIAGLTGTGAYLAASELNKPGEVWVIGVDAAQDHLAPGYELCVGNKGVDFAVWDAIRMLSEGRFEAGTVTYDLVSGGIGISFYDDRTPVDVIEQTLGYKKAIVDGKIVTPTTDDELAAFQAPTEKPAPEPYTPEATPSA